MSFFTSQQTHFAITTALTLCLSAYGAFSATIDLTSGDTEVTSTNSDTYNFSGGDLKILGTNQYTLSGTLNFTANGTIMCLSTSVLTLSGGSITGNYTLIKASPGTLVLDQSATALAYIQINAGTLKFSNGSHLPNIIFNASASGTLECLATTTISNKSITLNSFNTAIINTGAYNLTFDGTGSLIGAYTLTKSGAGAFILGKDASGLTGITVSAGSLQFTDGAYLPDISLASGTTLTSNATANTTISNKSITLSGNSTINTGTYDLTFSGTGSLSGAYTLTKSGAGAFILGKDASGLTGITVSAGSLQFSNLSHLPATVTLNGGALAATSNLTYANTLTFTANSSINVGTGITMTLDGATISGNFALSKTGAGTLVVSQDVTNLTSLSVAAGTLQFSNASHLPGTITLNGGTLSPTSALTLSNSITLTANSSLTAGTGITLTLSGGSIAGAYTLTLSGAGTVELGENAYDLNEIIVSADSTLKLTDADRKIKKITNNGTLNLNGYNLYITDTNSTLGTVVKSATESIYLGDNNTGDSETITLSQTITAPLVIESGNTISVSGSITLPKITVGGAIDSSGVTG